MDMLPGGDMPSDEGKGDDRAGRRVLVVDDEALVAFDIADQCEDYGLKVIGPALTLDQGIALLREDFPDIALLDINLRDQLVWPLARELREREVPVIFISANCRHPEIDFEFAGAQCLEKPVGGAELLAAIRRILPGVAAR